MLTRWASPPGGWARAAPARRTPSRPTRAFELHAKPGDTVAAGQPLLTLHTDTPERFDYAIEALASAVEIAPEGTEFTPTPIVLDRIA